jgi:hypothetical protein
MGFRFLVVTPLVALPCGSVDTFAQRAFCANESFLLVLADIICFLRCG